MRDVWVVRVARVVRVVVRVVRAVEMAVGRKAIPVPSRAAVAATRIYIGPQRRLRLQLGRLQARGNPNRLSNMA